MASFSELNISGLSDSDELNRERCLLPDEFMDFHHPDIQSKVQELTDGLWDSWDKAAAIFQFIRDEIVYDFAPKISGPENWKASVILDEGRGFCHQKSILQSALYRAAGIPSALYYQDVIDYPLLETRYKTIISDGALPYHGLSVILLDHIWVKQDATLDSALCIRRGYRISQIKRGNDALLPKTTVNGKPHFKILKEHGYFESFNPRFRDGIILNFHAWNEWRSFVKKEHLSM
ncbi:MAG: transglutaminase family protein [Fidelibacterota bacterium]